MTQIVLFTLKNENTIAIKLQVLQIALKGTHENIQWRASNPLSHSHFASCTLIPLCLFPSPSPYFLKYVPFSLYYSRSFLILFLSLSLSLSKISFLTFLLQHIFFSGLSYSSTVFFSPFTPQTLLCMWPCTMDLGSGKKHKDVAMQSI